MAAVLMALVASVFVAGIAWLLVGNRFEIDPDPKQNDLLNLASYLAIGFVGSLVVIIWWTAG